MNRKYILLLALLFVIAFPFLIRGSFTSYKFFMDKWDNCLDYLGQGTLYGGQPFCIQGPVLFLISYPFTIFGYYFDLAIAVFSFLLVFFIFILGNKIIKKESGKESLIIYTILFCFIFLYFSLTRFASFLGTAFFFFAVYILFYTRLKYKVLYAGTLFALSIFSKFNYIIFVFVIILYYIFKKLKILKKFNYKKLKPLILLLLPTIILFIVFEIIWYNFLTYIFLTPLGVNSFIYSILPSRAIIPNISFSIYQIMKQVFSLEPFRIFILFAIIFSTISFFRNKRAIASIPSFGFPLMYIAYIRIVHRSFLPALLFFVILFIIEFNSIKKKHIKYVFFIFLLLLFLCPASKGLYLNSQFKPIQILTRDVLKELPVPEGKILGDLSLFELKSYGFNIDKNNYIHLGHPGVSVLDRYSKVLELFGVYNPKEWRNYMGNVFTSYSNEMISGKYSLILFSPGDYQTDLSFILTKVSGSNLFEKYCFFKIPNFKKGSINVEPAIYLFLKKDKEKCDIYYQIITDYYTRSFQKICDKSSVAGLLTKLVLFTTGDITYTNLECKYKKPDTLLKYYNKRLFSPKQKEIDLNNMSECFALTNNPKENITNLKIGIGKICKNVNDCKEYFEDNRVYFCEKSKLVIAYPLKICYTKKNCESFFSDKRFHPYIECNKGLCMYLSSFDSLGYFEKSHEALFSGTNFNIQNKMITKQTFLNIAEDYIS